MLSLTCGRHTRLYSCNEMIVKTVSAHNNPAAMQKTPNRAPAAFTLIELLVVIAIIAVLIGLLFPAFRAVQDQAKRTQAKNDLTQIVNAVNAYYTEYGKYPVNVPAGNTTDAYFGGGTLPTGTTNYGNNDVLFDVLRNNTDPSGPNLATVTLLNPRQVVFINPPYVRDPANPRGGIGTPTGTGARQFFDPWGTSYKVDIDTSYNNQITNPYTADTGAGPGTLTIGVIVWSLGKDGLGGSGAKTATPPGPSDDDVISWQ
jgi:prepilin-type N-terminal cleavage/methylation domain-containing protein